MHTDVAITCCAVSWHHILMLCMFHSIKNRLQSVIHHCVFPVECLVLLDGRGSLSSIATSSVDQLLDCSLSTRSANVLSQFFSQDCLL